MLKILVITTEPPPTSSGLGTLWAKLASNSRSVQFDFFGPDPAFTSPVADSGLKHHGTFYSPGRPPFIRTLAVRRNSTRGFRRFFWSLLYLPFHTAQRYSGVDFYSQWILRQIRARLPGILAASRYDAVLVHTPPFYLAEPVCRIAGQAGVPFIFAVGDPIGYRDGNSGFQPESPQLQQQLIDSSAVFVTTRQTFERYYAKAFPISPDKCAFFSDCFMESPQQKSGRSDSPLTIMHWGSISPWRPVTHFANALQSCNRNPATAHPLKFHVVGKIEGDGRHQEVTDILGENLISSGLRGYQAARALAQTADFFLISVSERHMDNIPSKMIDLLSFRKPMLVLASPDSECAKEIRRLGIGIIASPDNEKEIEQALIQLTTNREQFCAKYSDPKVRQSWSCDVVPERFAAELCNKLISRA